MSERIATWHDNGRGPRIVIRLAGEDLVISERRAAQLRDELTTVLEEIVKSRTENDGTERTTR